MPNLTHAQKVRLILSGRQKSPKITPMKPWTKAAPFPRRSGQITGGSGQDDIPAMLSGPSKPGEPGEFVMNKGAVMNLGLDYLTHQNLRGLGHLYNNYQLNAPDSTVPPSAPKTPQGVPMLQDGSGVDIPPADMRPGVDRFDTQDYGSGYDWRGNLPQWYQPLQGSQIPVPPSYQTSFGSGIPSESITASPPPMPSVQPDANTYYPTQSGYTILPGGVVGGGGGRNDFGYFRGGKQSIKPSGAGAIADATKSWNPPGMSRWQDIQQILSAGGGPWRPTLGTPNLRTSTPRSPM